MVSGSTLGSLVGAAITIGVAKELLGPAIKKSKRLNKRKFKL